MINYNDINHHSFFNINENFVDEYNSWNKRDRNGVLVLGETTRFLEESGLEHKSIVIDKGKLIKIKHKHTGLNDKLICQIPSILKNPTLIVKSNSYEGRIVVFGKIFDNDNRPILIALELNPKENDKSIEEAYKVASIYGKSNPKAIQSWIKSPNDILYYNKRDSTKKWLDKIGVSLPVCYSDKNIMIKDMPYFERPRERAIKNGVESLSNEDLLSIILKSGTKNSSVKTLSNRILSSLKDISELKNLTYNSLCKINGIGSVKAIELLSSLELGKRVYYKTNKEKVKLHSSTKIYEYFKDLFIDEKQENFYAVYLDTKSNLISYKLLFKGTINTSCVHPREVFKYAFLESAYSIIVMHNHPSGDATPSIQDEEITSSLFSIGTLVAIPVVDHIIFGNNDYYSFYEKSKNIDNN